MSLNVVNSPEMDCRNHPQLEVYGMGDGMEFTTSYHINHPRLIPASSVNHSLIIHQTKNVVNVGKLSNELSSNHRSSSNLIAETCFPFKPPAKLQVQAHVLLAARLLRNPTNWSSKFWMWDDVGISHYNMSYRWFPWNLHFDVDFSACHDMVCLISKGHCQQ